MDQLHIQCFDAETLTNFFVQVDFVYTTYNIKAPHQAYILYETGFPPGRDLFGKKERRVVTSVGAKATWLRVTFQYVNLISVLLCVSGTGEYVASAGFFTGIQEPRQGNAIYTERVSDLMAEGWVAF